jgi:hypothetical protein
MVRWVFGRSSPSLGAVCALLLAVGSAGLGACSGGEAGDGRDMPAPAGPDTPAAATNAPSATVVSSAEGSAALSTASAPVASALAASALPSAVPLSERPSAKVQRPPGIKAAQWQPIFDTYGSLFDIEYILDDHHRRHPDKTELVTLGTTHQGRPVKALLLADRPSAARGRPAMLLNGMHHGDEPMSTFIVLDAIEQLLSGAGKDPRVDRYLSELAIWCVPMVNPDGFAQFMTDFGAGRKNGRETRKPGSRTTRSAKGVDLNRNYPFRWGAHNEAGSSKDPNRRSYRGPAPASEPETRAMTALSDREHFVGSISYHIGTVALLVPYTIDGVLSPTPNEAWAVAEDVSRRIPKINNRPVWVRKNLYTVDGTDQDYHRFAHGTLALLLEAAARSWETPALRDKGVAAIRPSWGALFDRYLDGPSVEGHVRDEAGRPVAGDVQIAEVQTRAGEKWRARCSDGFFGRFLPGYGKFTVRVTPPSGGAVIEKVVEVAPESGRGKVEIVAPGAGATGCEDAGK